MKSNKPLWTHQKAGIVSALESDEYCFFWEMGTGKSRALIETLKARYSKKGRVMKTLILSPLITLSNWKNEFMEYSNMDPRNLIVLNEGGKKGATVLKESLKRNPNKIVIMNYEKVNLQYLFDQLFVWCPEVVVCDECHRCKSPSAKRSKAVERLASWADYRYLLTGTPILNNLMDVFQQFKILDGGESFGKNFYAFRAKYFYDKNSSWSGQKNHFPDWHPREKTKEEIKSIIDKKAMVVKKADCLDLPPLVKERVEVELSAQQKRMYKEMKNHFITWVSENKEQINDAVVAEQAITKVLRLQQIVTGFVKTEGKENIRITKNPRLDALKELILDLTPGHKVIVWACFKENYKMITEMLDKLEIKYAQVHGDISKKDAEVDYFRNEEECRVMVANQQSAGIGINLVEASYSIFYSKNHNLENDLQAEARNYRGGSERHEKITRIDLVAPGTIDELISKALENKQNLAEEIVKAPERYL